MNTRPPRDRSAWPPLRYYHQPHYCVETDCDANDPSPERPDGGCPGVECPRFPENDYPD